MIYYNINDINIEPYGITQVGKIKYKWICSGFDIETTTQYKRDKKGKVIESCSFCYHLQLSINNDVLLFRKIENLPKILNKISQKLHLKKEKARSVIFVHNLGFEFQFIRKYMDNMIDTVFAKKERHPIKVDLNNGITLLDSMSITNTSLEILAKNYCKTKKMVGDLDYTKQRNSKTKLSEKEEKYCVNDVVILSEFSEWYFSTFLNHKNIEENFLPITSTAIVRNELKINFKKEEKKKQYKDAITKCYPTVYQYKELMELFSGGYTHANIYYYGEVLKDVVSYDLTSSYPAVMLRCYYPVTPFVTIKDKINKKDFYYFLENKCCWFRLKIYNVEAKTNHSTISISKCEKVSNDVVDDNGRIRRCSGLIYNFNELDFKTFENFYSYSDFEIVFFRVANKGYLPPYVRKTTASYFENKQKLKNVKGKEKEYALEKAKLNSIYGMMVTKIIDTKVLYCDEWNTKKMNNDDFFNQYLKTKRKAILLPQWGVWVTSHARKVLLDMVYLIGNDVVYCDTDSIKMVNYKKHTKEIEMFNKKIENENKKFCLELDLDYNLFRKLGTFDNENEKNGIITPYEYFKTLGAKRYIYKDNGKWKQTIAGLPKTALVDYCENNNKDITSVFSDGLNLDFDFSNKMCSYYSDDEQKMVITDENDVVENVTVPSCLSLIDTTFKLNVVTLYKKLADIIKDGINYDEIYR